MPLRLNLDGFTVADLYEPARLADLAEAFYRFVERRDAQLGRAYAAYRQHKGTELTRPQESELLIKLAHHLGQFLTDLFGVEAGVRRIGRDIVDSEPLFVFRKEFIQKRIHKRMAKGEQAPRGLDVLTAAVEVLNGAVLPELRAAGHSRRPGPKPAANADELSAHDDLELRIARSVTTLLAWEKAYAKPDAVGAETRAAVAGLIQRLQAASGELARIEVTAAFPFQDALGTTAPQTELRVLKDVLALYEEWALAKGREQATHLPEERWVSFWTPEALEFKNLVPLQRPRAELPQAMVGPEEHYRQREGFALTDPRMDRRHALGQVDYCLYCHEREKDSCSRGLREKDGSAKKNPLGIPLEGCPLDERISEMHFLEKSGDPLAALAMCMIDNPLCPGTGHRICNDCMKACIFQKQSPVNIPQIETRLLTDVVYGLEWGFELYSLLTRWNPLNVHRPYARPYNGKNVLIVGLGPAGYTLAHYLVNEGFGVVGVDGLKIEPWSAGRPAGSRRAPGPDDPRPDVTTPIRDYRAFYQRLDERVLLGFGGVSEYGITVRWDKNFLGMIYLSLLRRDKFKVYGGIRFGGTLTIEDAWQLGFDHLALAAGAGRPTIIDIKNNLIRGIRKASDFLMALQLTGAAKKSSLANLQVRLPAVVVGGGLTGIDTATELMAYYVCQVEKLLARWETLAGEAAARGGSLLERFSAEEREVLDEQLAHGRAIRAERQAAHRDGRKPNFIPLLRAWGGVKLVYRKTLQDSPAYRLNHEEIVKALEEGIEIVECLNPVEAHPDRHGALEAVTFDVMQPVEGRWKATGQQHKLACRTLCVAAGTSPNTMYEREFPGTFQHDQWGDFFQPFKAVRHERYSEDSLEEDSAELPVQRPSAAGLGPARRRSPFDLVPVEGKARDAFFTSYQKDGRFISFYGDNHPAYAGNVVKAMSSAKHGFPRVVELFADEIATLRPQDQPAREAQWERLTAHLDDQLLARIERVVRLTPTIVEVIVRAPLAARKFQPGQFYRLQNFETYAPTIDGTTLAMEGLALTGAWKDDARGLLSLIVLEMGSSSRLCAALQPGEPVVCMGPTGAPTEIPTGQKVLLAGGGLGNAVLFSIGKALRASGCQVLYFAGYKKPADLYKPEEIEGSADQVIWCSDVGPEIPARRAQDRTFVGNIVQAMLAYGEGRLGPGVFPLRAVQRIIAIGSDRMMNAVRLARHGVLASHFNPDHHAIGSINSPMQCMMKEICAQCLQRHVDPKTGKEIGIVFSCFNQDQPLDRVDFANLADRLSANTLQEKLTNLWLDHLLTRQNVLRV